MRMNISEVSEGIEKVSLPSDQKKAILQLIDAKINDDMKEVIAKMEQLDSKIQMVHDKLSNEIKVVYWVVGIAMAIILFVVAKK